MASSTSMIGQSPPPSPIPSPQCLEFSCHDGHKYMYNDGAATTATARVEKVVVDGGTRFVMEGEGGGESESDGESFDRGHIQIQKCRRNNCNNNNGSTAARHSSQQGGRTRRPRASPSAARMLTTVLCIAVLLLLSSSAPMGATFAAAQAQQSEGPAVASNFSDETLPQGGGGGSNTTDGDNNVTLSSETVTDGLPQGSGSNNTNGTSSFSSDKSFKICSILGGLDVTRLVSSSTRSFFKGAIEDVEMMREFVSEAALNGGIQGGLSDPTLLSQTLDREARGLVNETANSTTMTTIDAGLGYVDDRSDRRIERYIGTAHEPWVGDKGTDMAIADSVSLLFPWIIDRKSNENSWWIDHQNGRSQGPGKEPFLFDALYTAAWLGTYGEAWAYYPPLRVYGHPFTFGDLLGQSYDSHGEEFVKPNLPENNPDRVAFFTQPYPDTAMPGLSLITAMAPIYFTGNFGNYTYNDTYLASTGVDIAVSSVSTLLDVLEDRLTRGSFGLLVDSGFNTVVLSQSVVGRIYPARTGFEESRVTYDTSDGTTILQDRRNQTYLVSDTILQPLTDLTNADWRRLQSEVQNLSPGERDYSTLDLTLTGEEGGPPTEFYVVFERWEHVADWVLMVFLPVAELRNTINVGMYNVDRNSKSVPESTIVMEGQRGSTLAGRALIRNDGTLDVILSPKSVPSWVRLLGGDDLLSGTGHRLASGESLPVQFEVITDDLEFGTSSSSLTFNVRDDHYPDCFYNDDVALSVSARVTPKDCASETGDQNREPDSETGRMCVCNSQSFEGLSGKCVSYGVLLPSVLVPLFIIAVVGVYVYVERKRKQADTIWAVKPSELDFGDGVPEVVGRGTFGLVLLAEYRGTKVAVKRVIPPKVRASSRGTHDGTQSSSAEKRNLLLGKGDLAPEESAIVLPPPREKKGKRERRRSSELFDYDENALVNGQVSTNGGGGGGDGGGGATAVAMEAGGVPQSKRSSLLATGEFYEKEKRKTSMDDTVNTIGIDGMKSGSIPVGTASGSGFTSPMAPSANGTSSGSAGGRKWSLWHRHVTYRDEYARLKADFVEEMRHLSKLRHPCITTVMGAVISSREEPMLVMEYMDHGSLYDVLHNETMVIEGELVLPILRDIAQGLRFLHAATPQVIHGDLKAANVLIDIKLRAKVADFGLSQKKRVGGTGTPFWMAPELLRGESGNTAASDVYSFGIILYEVYSRKDPYEGEDHRTVLQQVCHPAVNKRPPVPKSMTPAVASLMSDCLVADPASRPTFDELDNRLKRLNVDNIEPGTMCFSKQTSKTREAERNASLLLEVFPRHIAEALRDGRRIEPEHHDCVTIFFSDIVGFTTISSSISLLKVSDLLDRLYHMFDALSHEHDVFKIETIGDAWIGVTNLVTDQPDHAKRIAQFSIDAVEAASKTLIDPEDPERRYVQIRVGFHTGPVLSNVVGSRHPKYTIFGDTVNTSSRMESNSLPGRIHCSDRSAAMLQNTDISLVCRGEIEIKGKGGMTTYWVNEKAKEEESTSTSNSGATASLSSSSPLTVPNDANTRHMHSDDGRYEDPARKVDMGVPITAQSPQGDSIFARVVATSEASPVSDAVFASTNFRPIKEGTDSG